MKALKILLLIVALGVVAAASYYFGFDNGQENSSGENEASQGVAFSQEGLLLRNRDGLKADTWYLSYETNSQGRLAELSVSDEQIGGFSIGQRVAVTGQLIGEVLEVENISPVDLDESTSGANVAFRKSDVFGFYGTVTLTGYLEVVKRVCNPGDMCGETVDYASFVFRNNDNNAIKEFTGEYQGNSYVGDFAVGLGCQQTDKNRIYYENDADSGWKTGEISGSDYQKLIASSPENPVQLKLTREIYTSGRGAPDCYSHFRNFDVL